MKKLNNLRLWVRIEKEFPSAAEARERYGYESYSTSRGIATFKKFYEPEDINLFLEADKSLGFGFEDSVGNLENYYPRENDAERFNQTLARIVDKAKDPKYKYYWEIPSDGVSMDSELTCHDHYGSVHECANDCGTCSGARCCDDSSVIKRIYTVSNFHTGETLLTTYDKEEAERCYNENKLTEEATLAFNEICKMLEIDSDQFKKENSKLDITQLVYRLSHVYDVRVKSRN